MTKRIAFWVALAVPSVGSTAWPQYPYRHAVEAVALRFGRSQPVLHYVLRVSPEDLSGYDVTLRVRNAPDTFQLAMAAHPEYDDKYWRYLEGPSVSGAGARVVRIDSALWRVVAPGGAVEVRYRIKLPPSSGNRSAWRPFLAATGGLVGGPHSFLYPVATPLAPSHVQLERPAGWQAATGLERTSDPTTYFAPTAAILVDSPILIGTFRTWRWLVDGVPHRLVYWPLSEATPFDTTILVSGVERLTREAVRLFGRAPYREYSFLLQDGAGGGLEHLNSVTLGVPSSFLAQNPWGSFQEIAHEFFHTWNLMRIRPAEYRSIDYRTQPPTSGLWFSEGMSMFYADVLARRAGLRTFDSTRVAHLERLLSSYLANPGNARFSAEAVSRVAYNASPGSLGDFDASTHLQGELLGAMLDLQVRDATGGRRSLDDVMRAMLEGFSGERGFLGADIERTVARVCGCPVQSFFAAYVRGAGLLDFNRYLGLAGLRATVTRTKALSQDGQPAPDFRIRSWLPPGEEHLRLWLFNPESDWSRAGLHTGDQLLRFNGVSPATSVDFRSMLVRLRIGDTVRVEVQRPSGRANATIIVGGYDRPVVRIEQLPHASERQRRIREAWMTSAP